MSTLTAPPPSGASPDASPDACLDTEQVPPALREQALREGNAPLALLGYVAIGAYLGGLFLLSEVASWYRIQEMFRFDSFHMYGVIGSALAVAALSLAAIRRLGVTTVHGEPIVVEDKAWTRPGTRYWLGGTLFGLGWGLLGACPGPIFALIGNGVGVMVVGLAAALAGTWAYAALHSRLPH